MKPIPDSITLENWNNIDYLDNKEKLVDLTHHQNEKLVVSNKYYRDKIPGSIDKVLVRETVAKLIKSCSTKLPAGYKLFVWDGWRPLVVQRLLYKKSISIQKEKSNVEKEIKLLAEKYSANPDSKKIPPHLTGGAIDVSLMDEQNNIMDMGTELDHFGKESATTFYENKSTLSNNEIKILNNRRILYWLLVNEGFTNYAEEWWHYDYGNQFWGFYQNKYGFYGPILNY